MRTLVLFLLFSAAFIANGQRAPFVRVVDTNNVVIARGRLAECSDSMVVVHQKNIDLVIDVYRIKTIKTGRSPGHYVITGTIIGIGAGMAATAIAFVSEFNKVGGTTVASGFFIGAPAGAAVGGLTSLFTRRKTYAIDGSREALAGFRQTVRSPR